MVYNKDRGFICIGFFLKYFFLRIKPLYFEMTVATVIGA